MENIHQGHREKMRQRFLKSGLEGFADHEALELLLYYAFPGGTPIPLPTASSSATAHCWRY